MRIISGIYKGRVIKSPAGNTDVRPTTDRAKETLFNILINRLDFENKNCLDLYCGTGNLGLEFISRGGQMCTFVDLDVKTVKENIYLLKITGKTEIIRNDATKYLLNNTDKKFDLVFADPPYKYTGYDKLLYAVSKYKLIFILEHDSNFSVPSDFSNKIFLKKKIGITNFTFFDFN